MISPSLRLNILFGLTCMVTYRSPGGSSPNPASPSPTSLIIEPSSTPGGASNRYHSLLGHQPSATTCLAWVIYYYSSPATHFASPNLDELPKPDGCNTLYLPCAIAPLQVLGCVPGAAPLPPQVSQASLRWTLTSVSSPDATSSKFISRSAARSSAPTLTLLPLPHASE